MASRATHIVVLLLLSVVACNSEGSIEVTKKFMDSPLEDIQWADDLTVFVQSEKGVLYRSESGGRVWENEASKLGNGGKVDLIEISEADPRNIFFVGKGKNNWQTTDMGATYKSCAYMDIVDVSLHPTKNWILGSTMSEGCKMRKNCYKELHLSKDFGITWNKIVDYIVQFDWSPPVGTASNGNYISDEWIYVTSHETMEGNQRFGFWDKDVHFAVSRDLFKSFEVLVPYGNRFLFGSNSYLFVATVNPERQQEVTLSISRDNSTSMNFQKASLPVSLSEHSYTILDTSEGTVFLHVNHQPLSDTAYAGHVYISDWTGVQFSLSLPFNHRNAEGKCDFEKIEGVEGIYLANFIDEEEVDIIMRAQQRQAEERARRAAKAAGQSQYKTPDVGKTRSHFLRTKTVISFDKGAEWHYLAAPRQDANKKRLDCDGDCHLHLHGITDMFGPFYSTENAVGLIMATGTIGDYLEHHHTNVNTYLSRDAGLSWKEVAQGSHIYEFGDHGGLTVMAKDDAPTNVIKYSWDEGITWSQIRVTDEVFQVENIIIEPSSVSQQFVVYGWQGAKGVLVYVDFSNLHERDCQGHDSPDTGSSDYETWSPSDGRLRDGKCLLGRTVSYTRLKAEKKCFNPVLFERPIEATHCQCTEEDYQCDFGYARKELPDGGFEGDCLPLTDEAFSMLDFTDPNPLHPKSCPQRITKGYVKVPGSSCINGEKWEATLIPCETYSSAGRLVFGFLTIITIVVGLVALASKFNVEVDTFTRCLRGKLAEGYRLAPSTIQGGDDDAFYLSDDDFGPAADLIDSPNNKKRGDGEMQIKVKPNQFSALPMINKAEDSVIPVLQAPSNDMGLGDLGF